ncbi:hypothetical protein [Kiloniella spongiae]|nr:hypothetical protein [Kiloniella spongiae]
MGKSIETGNPEQSVSNRAQAISNKARVEDMDHEKSNETMSYPQGNQSALLEQLYDRGVLGPKDSRDGRAERRRDNGFWLMELYEFLYHSEGVARYEPFSGGAKGYGAEMSDEEAELRALYHRYLRGLPAVVTQSLRFLCKDQQMPRIQTIPLADCLDQLDQWRAKERKERRGRE